MQLFQSRKILSKNVRFKDLSQKETFWKWPKLIKMDDTHIIRNINFRSVDDVCIIDLCQIWRFSKHEFVADTRAFYFTNWIIDRHFRCPKCVSKSSYLKSNALTSLLFRQNHSFWKCPKLIKIGDTYIIRNINFWSVWWCLYHWFSDFGQISRFSKNKFVADT